MNNSDLMILGLAGAAAVLVAKAAGLTGSVGGTVRTGATTFAQSIWNPINPLKGTSYDPANPGAYIPNSQLINGTIHDYYTGNTSSYSTPSISAIIDSVLTGGSKPQSVVRNPGAWW